MGRLGDHLGETFSDKYTRKGSNLVLAMYIKIILSDIQTELASLEYKNEYSIATTMFKEYQVCCSSKKYIHQFIESYLIHYLRWKHIYYTIVSKVAGRRTLFEVCMSITFVILDIPTRVLDTTNVFPIRRVHIELSNTRAEEYRITHMCIH